MSKFINEETEITTDAESNSVTFTNYINGNTYINTIYLVEKVKENDDEDEENN